MLEQLEPSRLESNIKSWQYLKSIPGFKTVFYSFISISITLISSIAYFNYIRPFLQKDKNVVVFIAEQRKTNTVIDSTLKSLSINVVTKQDLNEVSNRITGEILTSKVEFKQDLQLAISNSDKNAEYRRLEMEIDRIKDRLNKIQSNAGYSLMEVKKDSNLVYSDTLYKKKT
jgi:hypothetical protein